MQFLKYLALREACTQLEVQEDDLNIDDDVEKFVQGDNIVLPLLMMNGTLKCLKRERERDDDGTDDEEASIDENNLALQSDKEVHTFDYIQSRSGITYTSQLSECSRKIYCELFSGTQIEWFGSFPYSS